MEILRLRYDLPLKVSTNAIYSGMHYTKRKKQADIFHRLTNEVQQFKTLENKVDLIIKFYFRTKYLDSSNCTYMGKMIEDSLVKNGLLQDDSNKFVGSFTCESVVIEPKQRKKIDKDYVRVYILENCQGKSST